MLLEARDELVRRRAALQVGSPEVTKIVKHAADYTRAMRSAADDAEMELLTDPDRLARIDAALADPDAAVLWTPRARWRFETELAEIRYEQSGQAAILEIDTATPEDPTAPFVRLYEWTEGDHPFMDSLVGRRVRVTVEVMPSVSPRAPEPP